MSDYDQMLVDMLAVSADRLAAYGYLLTGSQHAGEELVQSAVVKVFSRRRGLGTVPQAEAYVRATMRTVHIDGIRRDITWRRLMPKQAATEVVPDASSVFVERDSLARALNQLPLQKRTAVVLRFYDDLSYAEIAQTMRISLGAVKRYLSDGIAELGGHLDISAERVNLVEGTHS